MAKVTANNLAQEIEKLLDDYAGDVAENLSEITKQIGKKGVAALKSESKEKFGGSGDYAKGWKAQTVESRLYTTVTIYNSKLPGLPHLLEFGHAIVAGGRNLGSTKPVQHISNVEEELVTEFEQEVISKL